MPNDSAPPLRLPSVPAALRRHRVVAASVLLATLLAAVLFTLLVPAPATATAQLGLTDPRGNSVFRTTGSLPTDLARFTQQRATFASSNQVLQRAADILPGGTGLTELRRAVTTSVGTNADVLSITAAAPEAETAAARANAVAQAYRELTIEQTDADAETALAALAESGEAEGDAAAPSPELLRELELQASQLRLAAELYGDGVVWAEAADPELAGGGPALLRNLAIGVVLGALGGIALAVALAARRPTTEDADAPFASLGAPLLGELDKGQAGQGFDVVAATLHAAAPGGVVAVSATSGHSDVAWFCADVLKAATRAGLRVAALDGAFETASLSALLRDHPGASGGAGAGVTVSALRAEETTLSRSELSSRLGELRQDRDLVLINCPALHASPAATLLQSADAVVAVVPRGAAESGLQRWRRTLHLLEAPLLGYVFVRDEKVRRKSSGPRRPATEAVPSKSRSQRVPMRSPSYSPAGT